jgi:hypothetical protein
MNGDWASGLAFLAFVVLVYLLVQSNKTPANPYRQEQDARIVCPHCHAQGYTTTEPVKLKKGISGGKATAALFTGGVPLLFVGLSRKEQSTKAHCSYCGSAWHF